MLLKGHGDRMLPLGTHTLSFSCLCCSFSLASMTNCAFFCEAANSGLFGTLSGKSLKRTCLLPKGSAESMLSLLPQGLKYIPN